jgi:hypothetical protein
VLGRTSSLQPSKNRRLAQADDGSDLVGSQAEPAQPNQLVVHFLSPFHHQSEALALIRHYRLFTHLLPYDYPDLTLSGGAGVAVLRTARAAADRPFRRPRR